MRSVKTIFIITILGILIFGVCTLLSYLLSKELNGDLEFGWPYKFFFQSKFSGESGSGIRLGIWQRGLIYNCMLSFVFAVLVFFVYKKIKGNNLKTSA